jgi:hypothetical protein
MVRDFYAPLGRLAPKPVVFIKLQLIAYFEGRRSEWQLMETVNVNPGTPRVPRLRADGSGA